MLEVLLDLVEAHDNDNMGLSINIYHSSVVDTMVEIGFKATRPGNIEKYGSPFITTQSCDRQKAFAEAYVKLTNWLSENNGGY